MSHERGYTLRHMLSSVKAIKKSEVESGVCVLNPSPNLLSATRYGNMALPSETFCGQCKMRLFEKAPSKLPACSILYLQQYFTGCLLNCLADSLIYPNFPFLENPVALPFRIQKCILVRNLVTYNMNIVMPAPFIFFLL